MQNKHFYYFFFLFKLKLEVKIYFCIILWHDSFNRADMSSTAFIEPLPVIEFISQLLNREISSRPLSDADRVKVQFFPLHLGDNMKVVGCYVPFMVNF